MAYYDNGYGQHQQQGYDGGYGHQQQQGYDGGYGHHHQQQGYGGYPQQQAYDPHAGYAYGHQDPFAGGPAYPPPSPYDEHAHMHRQASDHSYTQDPFVGSKEKLPREDGGFAGSGASQGGGRKRGSVAAMMAAAGEIPKKEGLRMWRHDEHAGEFTKGGRKRMCGRCCCCTIVVVLLLIAGGVAAFLLWVRPPNVTFNGVEDPEPGLERFEPQPGGFRMNFNLNVGVSNPNFFGANFEKVTAKAFLPVDKSSELGGGSKEDIAIASHSNTTIHFPFTINYTMAEDPGFKVLSSLCDSCGFLQGSVRKKIEIDYDLTVKVKVTGFSISPTFSHSTEFDCPIEQSALVELLASEDAGSLGPLVGLLGGGGGGGSRRSLPDDEASTSSTDDARRSIDSRSSEPVLVRARRRHGWAWAEAIGLQ